MDLFQVQLQDFLNRALAYYSDLKILNHGKVAYSWLDSNLTEGAPIELGILLLHGI